MKRKLILLLTPLFFLSTFFGQLEYPEDKVQMTLSVEQSDCEVTIIAKINIIDNWHINAANLPESSFSFPTSIQIDTSSNYIINDTIFEPHPHQRYDSIAKEELFEHSGQFLIKRKITVLTNNDFTLKGVFSFQTCDDKHCLMPYWADFEVEIKGCNADNTTIIEENDDSLISNKSLIALFFLAFGSGFAALLTPCVFPMIPMTVSFFTKQSDSKSKGIRNAILYGFSIMAIYVLLGTIVTAAFGSSFLNELATGFWANIFFFVLITVFAISFLGAFEISLPNSWINKSDKAADRAGLIGIFFMAFTLALVSFSCTGPIVGPLLVQSATVGGMAPIVGMLGFSLALALPFSLFAAFPGWLNSLPKSGGWLNTVKVFLGFLELALALKFLSMADMAIDGHYIERELFLAIWIGIFLVLALYLFGFIKLPHDSPLEYLSVGRTLIATFTLVFVIYLIPGLWGAPLKLISGFDPPKHNYSESPMGFGGGAIAGSLPEKSELGPHGIFLFHNLQDGLEYAKKSNKPVLLDFTGINCVNCRRMENKVWGESGVIEILKDKLVVVSLEVDNHAIKLPKKEQVWITNSKGKKEKLKTIGNKWGHLQASRYKANTQPYYRLVIPLEGENYTDIDVGSADYEHHGNRDAFKKWLEDGLTAYEKAKN